MITTKTVDHSAAHEEYCHFSNFAQENLALHNIYNCEVYTTILHKIDHNIKIMYLVGFQS